MWQLPRSLGPAGLITATAADVLAFARMHLTGGLAADGTRLLSEESAAAMAAHQADLPDKIVLGDSWGLGWIRFGWDGQPPDRPRRQHHRPGGVPADAARAGLAVTLLTNGGNARDLYEDLYRELFAELAGVEMPAAVRAARRAVEVDITPYVGTYERALGADGGARRRRRPAAAHDAQRPDRRAGARPGRGVPAGAGRPRAVRGPAAGGRRPGRR